MRRVMLGIAAVWLGAGILALMVGLLLGWLVYWAVELFA